MLRAVSPVLCAAALLIAPPAFAATEINAGNTAWVLTATALVLFMTLPGLALFYGGLVRARNLLSVLMHCFAICCLVSLLWAIAGYALAFGEGGMLLGPLDRLFLAGLGGREFGTGLPEAVFCVFQMTFAVITPALIVGAFPERVRFPFVLLFTGLWVMLVYVPVAHWVWGGGWLAQAGAIDFAGGIVVHTTAGLSALVAAMVIGSRRGFPQNLVPPHSPGLTMAGAGMLWFGWFGFNGGSALAADGVAGSAILATQLSASAAALTWMAVEWAKVGKPTSIGIVTGAIAGLAAVTPASGFVGPMGAIVIGILSGALCFYATNLVKHRFRIDDSLDVFAVHGVGGMLGSLLVAPLALTAFGGNGLAQGMTLGAQIGAQLLGIVVVAVWSVVLTYFILKLCAAATGLRVKPEHEYDGLDLSAHGERAYDTT